MAAGMAGGSKRGKAAADGVAPRHPGQLRPVGAVLPAITRPIFRKEGALLGMLLADWPAVVGPTIAAAALPRRLAAGTLTLACAGPMALELQHLAGLLAERVNAHLGRPAVQRLRFVQSAARVPPVAPPAVPRRATAALPAIEGFTEGPLHDALRALGAALAADEPERA